MANDSFVQASVQFVKWLAENNVDISPKLELKDLRQQNQGRGIVAIKDIKEDEELFSLPRSVCLSIDNCTLIKDKPEAHKKLLHSNHWDSLIVALLYELKVVGEKSHWYPYFQLLPITDSSNYVFNQLMFWTEDELKHLHPSLITDRIGADLAEGMYNDLKPKLTSLYHIEELKDITLEDYHKTASVIMSYSFNVERPDFIDRDDNDDDDDNNDSDEPQILRDGFFKTMVPLADVLNADTFKHNASLVYTKDKLVMRSIKPIKAGDQVYNTYSDHPNSEILRRYGYVEIVGSKHDFGEIPLATIKKFFIGTKAISPRFLDEALQIIDDIVAKDEENEFEAIVLDSYDCFASGDVIVEFTFLIQFLTMVCAINLLKSMEHLTYESKYALLSRIFFKSYQLLESHRLTKIFLLNYKKIISMRLQEYPDVANESFNDDLKLRLSRTKMAHVVLKSEFQSLTNCLNAGDSFKIGGNSYVFIDDEKLIKNIIKKKFQYDVASSTDEDHEPHQKKHKKEEEKKEEEK